MQESPGRLSTRTAGVLILALPLISRVTLDVILNYSVLLFLTFATTL